MNNAYSQFNVGTLVYLKDKARKGEIHKIFVKDIKYVTPLNNFLYKDSFNAVWNEEDLCNYDDAIALIYAYKNDTLYKIDEFLR